MRPRLFFDDPWMINLSGLPVKQHQTFWKLTQRLLICATNNSMLLYMYYLGSLSRGTNHDHIFQAFRAAILDYGINTNTNTIPKTSDHIQIKIKIPSPSQEPADPVESLNQDLRVLVLVLVFIPQSSMAALKAWKIWSWLGPLGWVPKCTSTKVMRYKLHN